MLADREKRRDFVVVRFGAFAFDDGTRELRCGDGLVHLSPKAFELLGILLNAKPVAVSKTDLHHALWPHTFVSDGNLAVLIAEIRRALGDSVHAPTFIRTVSRFGYAFIAEPPAVAASTPARHCYLSWTNGSTPLKPGENILGRDPQADVYVDAVGVSRRHAMITIAEGHVTIHDLSSKNGTFVNGTRITAPLALQDDAEIRLGAVSVLFKRARVPGPTQTIS